MTNDLFFDTDCLSAFLLEKGTNQETIYYRADITIIVVGYIKN